MFDAIVTESLDRLSRSQADIAALFEKLQFLGVRIETLADGAVSEIHVGLKGSMSALFLKDLAQKTRRGQIGRVKAGRIPGGKCYGYDVLKDGDDRGRRAINAAEAIHRLVDHPVHIGFMRDVGFDRKGLTTLGNNTLDGVVSAGPVHIGDRDVGPFPRKQQRHRPAVSNRVGGGVERPLSAADDQNLAALESPATGCLTRRFRAELTNRTYLVRHLSSHRAWAGCSASRNRRSDAKTTSSRS